MIFGNPVHGTIYLTPGAARWYRSQRFGCTGFTWERPLGDCAHYHRGIDIARGPDGCGDDLLAAASGTVHFAGRVSDGAIVIEIDHGSGQFTLYGHCASELVSVGQKVSKGQKIGTVGKTGNATGCHVHFAFKTGASGSRSIADDGNGTWRDPWPLLEANVTVHPITSHFGVNIRRSASTDGAPFATTKADGQIHRVSDDASLGAIAAARKWGGHVTGGSYTVDGVTGNTWERIYLDGDYRLIASPLAVRSA